MDGSHYALLLLVVLLVIYLYTRKESFGGVNPNDVQRIMRAVKLYPTGPAEIRNVSYELFLHSIMPTRIHEWTFRELQNLGMNNMLLVPNVRMLLALDAKYSVHPASLGKLIDYPAKLGPPMVSRFVLNVGEAGRPKFVVSTK